MDLTTHLEDTNDKQVNKYKVLGHPKCTQGGVARRGWRRGRQIS